MAEQQIQSTDDAEKLYADKNATALSLLSATRWVIASKRSIFSFFNKVIFGDQFQKIEEYATQIEFSIANTPKGKASRDNAVTRKQARELLRFVLDHEPDTGSIFKFDKELATESVAVVKRNVIDPAIDIIEHAPTVALSGLGTILAFLAAGLGIYFLAKSSSSSDSGNDYEDEYY